MDEIQKNIDKDYYIGKKIADYTEKYSGTDKFNVALSAIEFGYNLANPNDCFDIEDIKNAIKEAQENCFDVLMSKNQHITNLLSPEEIIEKIIANV